MSPVKELHGDRYKWIALTNTTLGVFMATINSSIIVTVQVVTPVLTGSPEVVCRHW